MKGIERIPLEERLLSKIEKRPEEEGGCWLWTGSLNPNGYGQIMMKLRGNRPYLAHRITYEHFVGPIPKGLQLDHLCRVPRCVNPAHLEPVTNRENMRRGIRGVLTTHCPQSHEYTAANTYITKAGHRLCKTCGRERAKARRRGVFYPSGRPVYPENASAFVSGGETDGN